MSDTRAPIPPNPSRWNPNPDTSSINVPGLDRDASVTDQIEQIEQLITIKLQNIDENFSKIHNVLATKILPAVKRYSIGTKPVRESAKFWNAFYEEAAQIKIPSYDDHSTVNEISSETEETSNAAQDQTTVQQGYEPSLTQTESSFMPGQDAFSSTPATTRAATTMDSFASHGSNEPSWANSIEESPLLRLKSEIHNFSTDDDSIITTVPISNSTSVMEHSPAPDSTFLPPSTTKSRGKKPELLRNVLQQTLYSHNQSSSEFTMKGMSPKKFKGKPKTPVPKEHNPYISPGMDSSNWSGIVDLRDPSVLTPKRDYPSKPSSSRKLKTPARAEDSDDESFDGLPQGMSPPVLMSPARPPRSAAELGLHKLGQTPSKQAASRIVRDIIRDVQGNSGFKSRSYYGISDNLVESSMSTVPTPPSLSRYHRGETSDSIADSSLDSLMRRVGLDVPSNAGLNSTPGLRIRPRVPAPTQHIDQVDQHDNEDDDDSFPEVSQGQLFTPNYMGEYQGNDLSSDSDSLDMDDEINNTAHPSAAFLMASQGRSGDDSFGSSNQSGDSLDEDVDVGGLAPIHPFGGTVEDDGLDDDDSFDYQGSEVQEETLFGVGPAQRLRAQAAGGQQGLRLMGEGLLDDTIGIQTLAGNGGVEESPTPAAWHDGGNLK